MFYFPNRYFLFPSGFGDMETTKLPEKVFLKTHRIALNNYAPLAISQKKKKTSKVSWEMKSIIIPTHQLPDLQSHLSFFKGLTTIGEPCSCNETLSQASAKKVIQESKIKQSCHWRIILHLVILCRRHIPIHQSK